MINHFVFVFFPLNLNSTMQWIKEIIFHPSKSMERKTVFIFPLLFVPNSQFFCPRMNGMMIRGNFREEESERIKMFFSLGVLGRNDREKWKERKMTFLSFDW